MIENLPLLFVVGFVGLVALIIATVLCTLGFQFARALWQNFFDNKR